MDSFRKCQHPRPYPVAITADMSPPGGFFYASNDTLSAELEATTVCSTIHHLDQLTVDLRPSDSDGARACSAITEIKKDRPAVSHGTPTSRWRACLARFLVAFSLRRALSWSMSATVRRSAGSSTTARFCSSVCRRRAPGTFGLLLNGSAACARHMDITWHEREACAVLQQMYTDTKPKAEDIGTHVVGSNVQQNT